MCSKYCSEVINTLDIVYLALGTLYELLFDKELLLDKELLCNISLRDDGSLLKYLANSEALPCCSLPVRERQHRSSPPNNQVNYRALPCVTAKSIIVLQLDTMTLLRVELGLSKESPLIQLVPTIYESRLAAARRY